MKLVTDVTVFKQSLKIFLKETADIAYYSCFTQLHSQVLYIYWYDLS